MPRKQRVVEKSLKKKGFVQVEGDHHFFTYYSLNGEKTSVFTKTSHGNIEISDPILSQMAKQCRLSNPKFLKLIDCPLDRQGYEDILVEGEYIQANQED